MMTSQSRHQYNTDHSCVSKIETSRGLQEYIMLTDNKAHMTDRVLYVFFRLFYCVHFIVLRVTFPALD